MYKSCLRLFNHELFANMTPINLWHSFKCRFLILLSILRFRNFSYWGKAVTLSIRCKKRSNAWKRSHLFGVPHTSWRPHLSNYQLWPRFPRHFKNKDPSMRNIPYHPPCSCQSLKIIIFLVFVAEWIGVTLACLRRRHLHCVCCLLGALLHVKHVGYSDRAYIEVRWMLVYNIYITQSDIWRFPESSLLYDEPNLVKL